MSAYNTISVNSYDEDTFQNVVHPDALARQCLLDNGRHALGLDYSTAPDLGLLSQLPVELLQQVILELDVASLLVWRRVNKRGMYFIACMIEWKKITILAPSTLRMAIGLRSHSTFSFADLVDALHQRTCGTLDCTNTVLYIKMKALGRLCANCFHPYAWLILRKFDSASCFLQTPLLLFEGTSDQTRRPKGYAEESKRAMNKAETTFRVRFEERVCFVYVGALERRGRGIEGAKGKGINDGDLDRRWAGGSAWE